MTNFCVFIWPYMSENAQFYRAFYLSIIWFRYLK